MRRVAILPLSYLKMVFLPKLCISG